jgi:hypothetical protein
MMNCRSMATPMVMNLKLLSDSSSELVDPMMYRKLIGSLMYLINTRQNICFAVNTLIQYMVEPRHVHLVATKHVLMNLHCTVGYGLKYVSNGEVKMQGYTKSSWVGSAVNRKSTSGCCFTLESVMISWLRRKQSSVALNTTEAKYIKATIEIREAMWLRKLLARLFYLELEKTLIYCDNKSCVKLPENTVFHDKSKHINIKYHFIRDMVQKGEVELWYISSDEQIENILTKPLSKVKYEYFRDKIGVMQNVHPR